MKGAATSTRRRGAHLAPRRRGRAGVPAALLAAAAIVAIVIVGILAGGGGSYALWNGGATAPAGTVTAGFVKVNETTTLPDVFTYHAGSAATTASVTVSNAGNVPGQLTGQVTIGAGSSAALAQAVVVIIWPRGSDGCTAASVPQYALFYGHLAGIVSDPTPVPGFGTLPAGTSGVFCFRTMMDVQSAAGVASGAAVNLGFTTTITAGDTWSNSTTIHSSQTFLDDIAPTTPGPLSSAHTTFASAVVSWPAATDNVGVTGYDVYRDGSLIASLSPSAVSVTDASVLAGSNHVYTVAAKDAAGNVSTSGPLEVMVPMPDAAAWYRVTNVASGLCVASQNSGNTDGTTLQQTTCAGPTLTSQSWQFQGPNSGGYYTVVARNAPTLAWQFGDPGTDTRAALQTTADAANQQWQALPQGDGRFRYSNRSDGMCLQASSTGLQQAACNSADLSQVFQLSTVTPLSTLVCKAPNASTTSVQYSWATPATGDANTAGYAMLVDGQPSNPGTAATPNSPYAVYNASYNAAQKVGPVSIEMRQELVSGGEVWIGTGSAIVGSDGTYTCG